MEIKLISNVEGLDSARGTTFLVKEALCTTIGKTASYDKTKEMTDDEVFEFMVRILLAEHSLSKIPLIRIIDTMNKDVRNQIFRHTKGAPHYYAQSSRPDWNDGKPRDPSEETKNVLDFNAEALLAMMKQRLCLRTESRTRKWAMEVVRKMYHANNPVLKAIAILSVPQCVYRAGCPELQSCGIFENKWKDCCSKNELFSLRQRCANWITSNI